MMVETLFLSSEATVCSHFRGTRRKKLPRLSTLFDVLDDATSLAVLSVLERAHQPVEGRDQLRRHSFPAGDQLCHPCHELGLGLLVQQVAEFGTELPGAAQGGEMSRFPWLAVRAWPELVAQAGPLLVGEEFLQFVRVAEVVDVAVGHTMFQELVPVEQPRMVLLAVGIDDNVDRLAHPAEALHQLQHRGVAVAGEDNNPGFLEPPLCGEVEQLRERLPF